MNVFSVPKSRCRWKGLVASSFLASSVSSDTLVMVGDRDLHRNSPGPRDLGGTPVILMIYVEDCDEVFERSVAAGATVRSHLESHFYRDRSGAVIDPFGHEWAISTHVEEDLRNRMAKMIGGN